MMDPLQLQQAASDCVTQLQALELVRRETAAMLHCYENITEDQARTNVRGRIRYIVEKGIAGSDGARILALFNLAPAKEAA